MSAQRKRCQWAGSNELMVAYHDVDWGVPVHDDDRFFEFLILETFQAGLSWSTILNKRESFRQAFDGFDVTRVAGYTSRKKRSLLKDPGIIRNRLKVDSAVTNAREFIRVQDEHGSFDEYVWRFVGGRPIQSRWISLCEIPATTAESDMMSKTLKKAGFKFVGSTICYAFMQATGMVNDHETTCFRYRQLGGRRKANR